ncbi:magnesium transporter CorA family protein [uncultured Clostridium sp.]|uniref:magnesium transporter CorA family protein n=1 Tax=uncultured Clostridium sp. TaxID=59620 RepID=UPI002586B62C|nr:CorA family divalent cation transporter [uncultured Clostridium sp.]
MITLILSNGSIIESNDIDENQKDVVGYLYNSNNIKKIEDKKFNNIHKDIVIKNKDMILLRIPILVEGEKIVIEAIIDELKFIVNYKNDTLIEFLQEKITLHDKIDKYMVCLFLFQYFSYMYNEELLELEEKVDDLFQSAVYEGEADNKEILEIKKSVSLIKRYTTYYKSMITYLDDELGKLDTYNKVLLVLDNTISLVENIESSIFSCIDVYNSELSNKMNKTMQLLTIITVLSLPLTIISGIFGMNFESMPLLQNRYGFILSMIFTIGIIVIEMFYFIRKKYI